MFESFFVYTFTAVVLYLLTAQARMKEVSLYGINGTNKFIPIETLLGGILFSFIAGARYDVGVDYLSYLSEYQTLKFLGTTSREDFEIGFLLISKFFANLDLHYFFFFAFWALLQIGFIFLAYNNRKYLLPYICLFIMLGPFFLNWMNGIRQSVVLCFFLYFSRYIIERKLLKYIISILLASTIHKSAMILLPLYFISYLHSDFLYKKYLNIFILLLCVFIGMTPVWLNTMTFTSGIMKALGYDFYSSNVELLTSEETLSYKSFGPTRLSMLFFNVIVIWLFPKMKSFYRNDKYLNVYFAFFLIGAWLLNLFANTNSLFLRPIAYFTIFQLPLGGYALYYLKKKKEVFSFLFLAIIMYSHTYFMVIKSVYMPVMFSNCNLYKFFFQ